MNIFQLKIIAMIAMFLDHIAYFFPDLPMSLPLHWIGRIAAPIFIFGVVNGVKYTSSKRMYILRLYLASIVMAVIQMSTQIELNFFRTLFIVACICEILEIRKNQKAVSWIKVLSLYIAYQVIVCIVCGYLSSISNMYTETICFYLIPALLGSVFTTEGGLIFVVLGIIMYLAYDNKKRLILSYMIFVVVYMFFMSTNIVPIILWKSRINSDNRNRAFPWYGISIVYNRWNFSYGCRREYIYNSVSVDYGSCSSANTIIQSSTRKKV